MRIQASCGVAQAFFLLFLYTIRVSYGFVPVPWVGSSRRVCSTFSQLRTLSRINAAHDDDKKDDDEEETGEVGSGPNWIERSFPVDIQDENQEMDAKKVEDYDLAISGKSFQTGSLSKRMYDAIVNTNRNILSDEVATAFTLYAMDFTAKEATRAALKQNGLEMVLESDMEDEGLWGDVDSIQLLDMETEEPVGPLYDTTDDAIKHWTPGQGFDFVVRQVPAKLRELGLDELLQALDPDGKLRQEAKDAGMTLPDEDITTLQGLANDCMRRSQFIPTDDNEPFAGLMDKRGYRVISRSDLLRDSINADGTENHKTLMHVMDALVSHGALVVDLTDGGTTYKQATPMAEMWSTVETLFEALDSELVEPGMTSVEENVKVGYASYDNETVQLLETHLDGSNDDVTLLPEKVANVLGSDGIQKLRDAFDVVADIGKDVVRIATAASSVEAKAFGDENDETNASVLASEGATRMVDDIVEDGRKLSTISASPQRFGRYIFNENTTEADGMEVFGPRVDSAFVTLVPVAALVGLEVFDEDTEQWYRPELRARKLWEFERESRGEDSSAMVESISSEEEIPWHARYVVVLPGDFLQLVTRNEVPASVHRTVRVAEGGPSRLTAPILLRGRPGSKMNLEKYLGRHDKADPLLMECEGMSLKEIFNAMQPWSFQ